MNYRMTGYLLGIIMLIEAALMILPLTVAIIYGESIFPFLITIAILLVISLPLAIFKPKNSRIFAKEGFVTVAAGWILLSAFGALPFVISEAIPNYIDAFFETVSGFTTTGASILTEIESLPKGILFWRSLTHWIGGMGVLVFILAILPSSGGQTIRLMRAEVPGPTKGKLVPKMKHTALILYGIYFVLTIIQIIALLLCRMPIYDAVVTSFATAGTGGFSVLNNSIAGYNNPAAEWVIAIFMFIFGVNFNLYFFILIGKIKDVIKSEEFRAYAMLCVTAVTVIAINTAYSFERLGDCIRASFFQVITIMSTTGFATVNYDNWPELSKAILVLLMIVGACAGSTAGGLKVSRILILFKSMIREIRHMLRPNSVNVIRLDGEPISDETSHSATSYLSIYVTLVALSALAISVDGFSLETNLTATLACINNIGPGLAAVGPAGNFSGYSYFSKIVLSLAMLIGRLEIMPMIILFSPMTWKKR
ncbi:MAG: TrkH family potassium uptake protein [Clostridia bacterium]|nr:TrkH family potassium uptake protein [Clostridia bacterium]